MLKPASDRPQNSKPRRAIHWRRFALGQERGASAVELGLMLPLLMLILLGTVDLGRFAFAAITISNAVRAGAAHCAYVSEPPDCAPPAEGPTQSIVQAEAQPFTISPSDITVTWPTSGPGCSADRPCLRVEVDYVFSTLFPWPGIPSTITISKAAQVVTNIEELP